VRLAMTLSDRLALGLVHHEDPARTESQKNQAVLIAQKLLGAGIDVITVEEFRQQLLDPANKSLIGLWVAVLRRLWAQEIHHLREIRRRRGSRLTIPFRKRRQALGRVFSLVRDRGSLDHAFRRLEIEAALSLKHVRIWNRVVDSDAMGALVLEDDFYLRNESSPADVASLVRAGFPDHDLIDLAGGLTRESLGLPESQGQDLSLPFLVANTTCAYFISKRACHALVEMVASNKELLYLAPDFLITELNTTDFEGSTLLPYDLPLVHGSRDGTVESSIPY
jgi:hypothetical protein